MTMVIVRSTDRATSTSLRAPAPSPENTVTRSVATSSAAPAVSPR